MMGRTLITRLNEPQHYLLSGIGPIQRLILQDNAEIYPSKVFLHTGAMDWMGNGHRPTVLTHSLAINIPIQPALSIP